MSLFDKIIDGFSKKDLKHRVKGVIAIGLAISLITVAGAYKFATTICTIDAEGTATLLSDSKIEITIPAEKMLLISASKTLDIAIMISDDKEFPSTIEILSIDPKNATITARAKDLPREITPESHFRIRVILDKKPYWQLLWGSGNKAL